MDEKDKRKPKRTPSALTPDDASTFFYEGPVALEALIRALTDLETLKDDVQHTVVLTPVSVGYTFRYEIVSPGVIKPRLSAYAEGRLWQDDPEHSVMEGTIHVAISNQDIALVTVMSLLPIPFLLLLPFAVFSVVTQRADAHKIKANLIQAVTKAEQDEQAQQTA